MRTDYAYTILSPVFEKYSFAKKIQWSGSRSHAGFRNRYRDHAPVSVGGRARVWIFHNSVLWFIATSVIFHRAAYEIKWLIAREKERWRMRPSEEEREGERERALKGGRRTPAAPSHDVGEPCIMSWPHYLSTTICPLLSVSLSRSFHLAPLFSLFLSIPSSIPVFISLSYTHSLFSLRLARRRVYASLRERERKTLKEKRD